MSKHYILDFEAFGQSPIQCPIINCAMYMFDWDRFLTDPYTFDELTSNIKQIKVSIKDQLGYGYKLKKKDLDWWDSQEASVKEQIKPKKSDVTLDNFIIETIDFITKELDGHKLDYWWSRANCYDPVIIQRAAEDVDMKDELDRALPFWLVRDTRTYIDTRFDFANKKNGVCPIDDEDEWNRIFKKHNSIHDVAADILRMQRIERIINE